MPRFSQDPRIERSLRRSLHDGVSQAITGGAGESYLSAYALLHKASAAQISLLSALPALLGSLAQWLSAWLESCRWPRKRLILAGALLQALAWFPVILLPYYFPGHAVAIIVAGAALYHFGGNLVTPAWSSLMGDLVPERRRGRFFARRARLMSLTGFLTLAIAGLALHYFEARGSTRVGFALVFGIAAAARFYSLYQLARMFEPSRSTRAPGWSTWRTLLPPLRESPFARFTAFFALMSFAVYIAAPFFTVYMLRDLEFSYLAFTACIAIPVVTQFLTLRVWGRLGDVFGNRVILVATGVVIPVLPALWLVSSNYWYILGIQVLGGLAWAGFSLSAGNYLYDSVPAERRAACAAVHHTLGNTAVFAGALLGGALSSVIPAKVVLLGHTFHGTSSLWGVLLVSTLARMAVACAFLPRLREVRAVRPLTPFGLVQRLLRFNGLVGFVRSATSALAWRWRARTPAAAIGASGSRPG